MEQSTPVANCHPVANAPSDLLAPATEAMARLDEERRDFIHAELQHLRELSLLHRMSDALAQRRDHGQIMMDAAREAAHIAGTDRIWLIEPNAREQILRAYNLQAGHIEPEQLPCEARDLFLRVVRETPSDALVLPPLDPEAQGIYMAMPIATAEHLLAVLVLFATEHEKIADSNQSRLLQTMLHQAAVACENAKLLETFSTLIVDIVLAMALAIESRDPYTGGHVLRVTAYAMLLAAKMGLSKHEMNILRLGGVLHDIGKVAVPDNILGKPGKLTEEEFTIMKSHAAVGHQIISPIPQLACCSAIVRNHHERYDGRGYPDGLAGESIPLLARITAVADTFDAMTSDRPYRKGMPFETAAAEIARCAGSQFDPALAKVFVAQPKESLEESARQIHAWRSSPQRTSVMDLLPLLDLDRPRLSIGRGGRPPIGALR